MLKHSNIARRRSLILTSDESTQPKNLDDSISRCDSPNRTFKRKYARSMRVRSNKAPAVEASSVVLRRSKNRHLSIRAKSTFIPPSEEFFEGLSEPKKTSRKDKFGSVKMKKFVQVKQRMPVSEWTTEDACDWLKVNNLDSTNMLSIQFRSYAINGRHLADPESAWEYMNKLTFRSDRHKQEVMLRLADCLRESSEKTGGVDVRLDRAKSPARVRFRPPSAISYSADSMMSSSDYVSGSSSSSTETGPSSLSEQDQRSVESSVASSSSNSAKKMIRAISSLKNAVSKPKSTNKTSDNSSPKKLNSIAIYSDLQGTGKFSQTELQVTETTTTRELLQMFMDFSSLSEDINLFLLSDVTIPTPDSKGHKGRGSLTSRRLLEPEECPLAVYKSFSSSSKRHTIRRLELTQSKGVVIKLICRIGNHKLRGKQFRVSAQSSVDHVIRLALRKFRLRNVEPGLFALCEISMSGDIVEIGPSSSPQWQNGTSLVLCDRPSLKKTKSDASGRLGKFKRSGSINSNLSFESRDSSGSESWTPYNLDRTGRLTEKTLSEEVTSDPNNVNIDVTIEDISITNDLSSSINSSPTFSRNLEISGHSDTNALSLDNSILQAELYEKSEQMDAVFRKVSQVRQVLESGLQKYHEESFYQADPNTGTSLAIENELKSTEKLINDTEELLGQLFRHQRQVLAKHNRSQSASSGVNISTLSPVEDTNGVGNLTDIELQIAFHQADLLALKHKHQVLDMKMSLFVANRKAEKFRHMISGSLYDIAGQQHVKNGFNNNNSLSSYINTVYTCEVVSGKSGYGLALRDDKDSRQGGARGKGAVMECSHHQGGLKEGDRLLEVNGINVQNVGADAIAKILKETSTARIVVLRREKKDTVTSGCDISDLTVRRRSRNDLDNDIVPSPTLDEEDIVIKNFTCDKLIPGSEEMADWREMGALKSDLSMLMSELEVTSRGKRELERDLAKRKNRDLALERENARLKEQIKELSKKCRPIDSCDSG